MTSPNRTEADTNAKPKADGKSILRDLESLMSFDQSQSSKWPRVTVYIESSGAVEADNEAALVVYPNGRPYNLERASDVVVPPEVIDALTAAMTARMVADKAAGNGYTSKDVMRFPFRVLDARSQKRYDMWKKALEVVRLVVTETRKKGLPDGKFMHETIARYLPGDKLGEAREVLDWANAELQDEKQKAAENQAAVA